MITCSSSMQLKIVEKFVVIEHIEKKNSLSDLKVVKILKLSSSILT